MALSFSQLQLYRRCPRQFEFAVVKKIGRPVSPGEAFGSQVHAVLATWGRRESGVGRGDTVQVELFAAEKDAPDFSCEGLIALWHSSFSPDAYATRVEADFARARGEKLLRHFHTWWAAEPREVLGIENGFSFGRDGVELSGRLDRVEMTAAEGAVKAGTADAGLRVIDFKTGSVRSQDEADADLQLSIYAIAAEELFGRPCTEIILLFLGEDGVTPVRTTRNAGQLRDALTQIRLVRDRIDSKDFAPTPSRELCGRCPYRGVCDASAVR